MLYLPLLLNLGLVPDSTFISPLLAAKFNPEAASLILAGVLLSLVFIYLAGKLGGELSQLVNLLPVQQELVGGVVMGVSALHLLVLPATGAVAGDSVIVTVLQQFAGLSLV